MYTLADRPANVYISELKYWYILAGSTAQEILQMPNILILQI